MRILGIDPGSVVCGYGVIDVNGKELSVVEYGVVHVKRHTSSFPQRLREIHDRLEAVIARTKPDVVSLEKVFHAKNVKSIVQLSQARGVAILACAQGGHDPIEYTPMQVKRSVTGRGAASKQQVANMVLAILRIDETPEYHDATDALAVAICHAVNAKSIKSLSAPLKSPRKKVSSRKAWSDFVKKRKS